MARSLDYADAVRLLGGQDSKIVSALEKIIGGTLLAVTPSLPAVLGLFDAKAEFVRLSHDLVRNLAERRNGLSRCSRTERLEAAHTVIVVVAFFEAMQRADLPFRFADLELTKAEQATLAKMDRGLLEFPRHLKRRLDLAPMLVPSPQKSPEHFLRSLQSFYQGLAATVTDFVAGLTVTERLTDGERARLSATMSAVPESSVTRYEELFRQLVADFPEVACWASRWEHRATRAALADLEEALRAISTGRAPDDRRAGLARAYRAELGRRIVESGDVPDGIRVPALGEGYLPPRFRAAGVPSAAKVSEESWWQDIPVRDDLQEFLIGHLTSPQAVRAPLLVLGQPGSGKSVLTRVLAARLPAADFLPVRVVLRDIPAADDVQDQIEHAIRQAVGDRVEWPALARSAGDAMPVIMLDGFDELLQAVGVSQTDYLVKVARFQRREAEQGRPVAVLVTSRTAVADRARAPEETVALRLEPFDEERVTAWLDIWNGANAGNFAARGLRPLAAETVLDHHELAGQPLLLLMLALYDADGNALQRMGVRLRDDELYEQLLRSFAAREIAKQREGLPDGASRAAVEDELRRLSVVAFAMFNRSALWVTEEDLERDLAALRICGPARPEAAPGMRVPLKEAELTLGRFFFIHRARASQDDNQLQTYEFLHATFGEYLVARLTWQVLLDLAARDAASSMSFSPDPVEDDLLRALLSFQPLCLRAPIIDFLTSMASQLGPDKRPGLRNVLLRLFRAVEHTPPGRRHAAYRPQSPGEPSRYAVYSANLLLLVLCVADTVRGGDLFADRPGAVDAWHAKALLWRSQLSAEGWTSLVIAVTLDRVWEGSQRDIALTLHLAPIAPAVDPNWTFTVPPGDPDRGSTASTYHNFQSDLLRRQSYFLCDIADDLVQHALEPLARNLDASLNTFARFWEDAAPSAAHALVQLWVNPTEQAYTRCAGIAASDFPPWDDDAYIRYGGLLLSRLATDRTCPPEIAAEVLDVIVGGARPFVVERLASAIAASALPFLGLSDSSDQKLARMLEHVLHLGRGWAVEDITGAEVIARLWELRLPLPDNVRAVWTELRAELIAEVEGQRPDLAERLGRVEAE